MTHVLEGGRQPPWTGPWTSLFWRVFVTNAVVLGLAFAGLVATPVRVSIPLAATELLVLAASLLALFALSLLLLRPAFRPLDARAHAFDEMLERLESDRLQSARSVLMLQESERRGVAKALHDELGQTLTGVLLQVEGLAAAIPTELRDQLDELRETARHGAHEARRIARRLRPETLEDLGLPSALAALATATGAQGGIIVRRHLHPTPALTAEQELVVYRIAQEALTNVVRHAAATHVELGLDANEHRTVLTVVDDGCGLAAGSPPSAHGIRGMRERAMLIGAALIISSLDGGGTQVRLTIPHRPARP